MIKKLLLTIVLSIFPVLLFAQEEEKAGAKHKTDISEFDKPTISHSSELGLRGNFINDEYDKLKNKLEQYNEFVKESSEQYETYREKVNDIQGDFAELRSKRYSRLDSINKISGRLDVISDDCDSKSAVNLELLRRLREAGIKIAVPTNVVGPFEG